jgi:hypothetical protein
MVATGEMRSAASMPHAAALCSQFADDRANHSCADK